MKKEDLELCRKAFDEVTEEMNIKYICNEDLIKDLLVYYGNWIDQQDSCELKTGYKNAKAELLSRLFFGERAIQKALKLKTMSTVEIMCENENVKYHVQEWEKRCLSAELKVEKAIGILEDAKDTIEYCKLYVENRALSAEDDCNFSLKGINDFLEENKS